MSYINTDRMKRQGLMTTSYPDVTEKLEEATQSSDKMVRSSVRGARKLSTSKRQLACTLHRQADQHHRNGDYETSLILYHHSAQLQPQNEAHSAAIKKKSTRILSTARSSIRKSQTPSTLGQGKMPSSQVPQVLKRDMENLLKKRKDPPTDSLRWCDTKKDFKGMRPLSEMELMRSQMMLSKLNEISSRSLHSLKESFNKKNFEETIKIGDDLLRVTPADQYYYQAAVHRYLALAHLSLRRHDRAIDHSVRMILTGKKSNDMNLRLRSFAVLGKVHLVFGHLNAAVRGWENLLDSLMEAVPRAWLLHEIGRGYYEMRNYSRALDISRSCCNEAAAGGTNRWMYHGKLLGGQALICLGLFDEGLETLQRASNCAEIDNDVDMVGYIQNLMDRVSQAMVGRIERAEKDCLTEIYSADLNATGHEEPIGTINDEFHSQQFTSRTQIIQKSQLDENNENPINTHGASVDGKIDESRNTSCCIVDKFRKYLEDTRTIKQLGISDLASSEELQTEVGGESFSQASSRGSADDGSGGSEDSSRTYGVETDMLYQCFVGNCDNSDED
ncbi:tetratricopeptide repeat protein 25-like [Fopius arisanus]|uniref:Tetratricopeptide repeat protein 25-like n=1 Tax=Fopius arisanus TaxID=64838 RepID=A0A9R1U3J7_9HYME|nr:PREDICTED: tetratricopeptide repeat protein 25-like [Fopius arisanus]